MLLLPITGQELLFSVKLNNLSLCLSNDRVPRFIFEFKAVCLYKLLREILGSTVPDFELKICQYKKHNISSDKDLVIYDRHLVIEKITRFLEREGNFGQGEGVLRG